LNLLSSHPAASMADASAAAASAAARKGALHEHGRCIQRAMRAEYTARQALLADSAVSTLRM
jgi:hypothetical protein